MQFTDCPFNEFDFIRLVKILNNVLDSNIGVGFHETVPLSLQLENHSFFFLSQSNLTMNYRQYIFT